MNDCTAEKVFISEGFMTPLSIKKDSFVCFAQPNNLVVFLGGRVSVEGLKMNMQTYKYEEISQVDNVYAFSSTTYSYFKVTTQSDLDLMVVLIPIGSQPQNSGVYVVLKSDFSVSQKIKYTIPELEIESELYIFLNSKGTTLTISGNDKIRITCEDLLEGTSVSNSNGDKITFSGKYVRTSLTVGSGATEGNYEGTVDISVKSTEVPTNYPNLVFKLEEDKIYSDDSGDATTTTTTTSNKLSGGAIAGIVIGSVLAAGGATFCIIWFAVLKKGCGVAATAIAST